MKENKQYKLKRWYPSLKKTVEVGCIITKIYTCGGYHYRGSDNEGVIFYVSGSQCENNPDFWELIEENKPKPLFITEDGVEVFDQEYVYYVTDKLEKINSFINWFTIENMAKDTKIFKHESNADEYIAWYKKEFSINDLLLANVGITTSQLDKLQELAKKSVK